MSLTYCGIMLVIIGVVAGVIGRSVTYTER